MEPQLPTVMELDSTERTNFSQLSQKHSYLERIRNSSVVSTGGSSSRSAKSSYYSSGMSSCASGDSGVSRYRYVPCSTDAPSFPGVGLEDVQATRNIANQMVRDGFVVNLIREFAQQAPGPALERW